MELLLTYGKMQTKNLLVGINGTQFVACIVLALLRLSLVMTWDGKLVEKKAFASLAAVKPSVTLMMRRMIKNCGMS